MEPRKNSAPPERQLLSLEHGLSIVVIQPQERLPEAPPGAGSAGAEPGGQFMIVGERVNRTGSPVRFTRSRILLST